MSWTTGVIVFLIGLEFGVVLGIVLIALLRASGDDVWEEVE